MAELKQNINPKSKRVIKIKKIVDKNGNVYMISYKRDGKFHRTNGPAYVTFFQNGVKFSERYYIDGFPENKNGPTTVRYHENGKIRSKIWRDKNDKCHREDGPAIENYNTEGQLIFEEWYFNDVRTRNNAPASIRRNKNGIIIREDYFFNNKQHRENDLPSSITYDLHGFIKREDWIEGPKHYRVDGKPTIVKHLNGGQLTSEYCPCQNRQ